MISSLKEDEAIYVNGGRGTCDCYCRPQKGAESNVYMQTHHRNLCRNYCLMHGYEFDKCVYIETFQSYL